MVLRKEIALQIKDLLKENPQGLSITDIVKVVTINRNTAGRYLENLLISGQVEMRRLGMAKIFVLSQRVPLSAVLSISSELIMQIDSSQRIIFANEPFLKLIGTDSKSLVGKNIEYTPVALVFDEVFTEFIENIRQGIAGEEWSGEIALNTKDIILFCRIAPTVFDDGKKGVSVIFEDITQRKQAERKIEESERQFRLLAENSIDMISRVKPDGTRIYVSPAYKATLGYEPEELLGKRDNFMHPDDAHLLESLWNVLTPENYSTRIAFRTKHKDGYYIWIESTVRAIFDEKTRELTEYYTVTRDITERKKAEVSLKESEERYRQLVDISPDAVLIHREGKIIFMNPAALNLLGASHSYEILGKNVLDFIHPDFREAVRKNIEKDLSGDISPPIELHMLRIDGTLVIVEGRGVKTNIDGKPAVQVAIRDITERKRAEEALRESEATARALLNAPTDSVILIDCEGKILALNEIAASRFGKRSDELVGIMSYDILPKEVAQLRRSLMAPVLEKREMVRFVDQRDGRWYDTVAYPIVNESGNVKKIAIIARDVTEQKNIEKQLRKSEQMYKRLLEQSFDAIAIHKQGKITFLNERAAKVLGAAKPEDLIGRPIFDFIHPESRKNLEDRLKELSATEGMSAPLITEKFIRIDGSTVTIEVMAISFDDIGIPAFRVAFREISTP
jgi:PAS domain S-box-containing protein